jgi:hypothetical protein
MLTLLTQLFRFLFTHVAGTALLAGLGFLFVCFGCSGLVIDPEKEPTPFTLAELEARSEPPKQQWLRLKDGHLVWAEAQSLTLQKKDRSGKVAEEKVKTVLVPLVSKAVMDEWRTSGGKFPFSKVRVYVRMDGDEFERHFSKSGQARLDEAMEKTKTPGDHTGLVKSLSSEDASLVEHLTGLAPGVSSKQVLVLGRGETPAGKGFMVCFGVFLMLFGLALASPLVLALARRRSGQGAEETSSGRGSSADAAGAGFARGLRGAIGDAVQRGIEAGRQKARPAPPPLPAAQAAPVAVPIVLQFFYLRDGQRFGPVSLTALRTLYRTGELRPHDFVWHQGAKDWTSAASSPHLK